MEENEDGWFQTKKLYKIRQKYLSTVTEITLYQKEVARSPGNHCISCDECGKLVASKFLLDIHKEKDHTGMDNESDQSFVFSESMLEEFL